MQRTAVAVASCALGVYFLAHLARPPILLLARRPRAHDRGVHVADSTREEAVGTAPTGQQEARDAPRLDALSAFSAAVSLWYNDGHAALPACMSALLTSREWCAWAVNHGALRVLPWLVVQGWGGNGPRLADQYSSLLSTVLAGIRDGSFVAEPCPALPESTRPLTHGTHGNAEHTHGARVVGQEVAVFDTVPSSGWSMIFTASTRHESDASVAQDLTLSAVQQRDDILKALHDAVVDVLLYSGAQPNERPYVPVGLKSFDPSMHPILYDDTCIKAGGAHSSSCMRALLLRATCLWADQGQTEADRQMLHSISSKALQGLQAHVTDVLSMPQGSLSSPLTRALALEQARAATYGRQKGRARATVLAAALLRQAEGTHDACAAADVETYAGLLSRTCSPVLTEPGRQDCHLDSIFGTCLHIASLKMASQVQAETRSGRINSGGLFPLFLSVWCASYPEAGNLTRCLHATPLLAQQIPMPTAHQWAAALLMERPQDDSAALFPAHVVEMAAPALAFHTAVTTGHTPDHRASHKQGNAQTEGGSGHAGSWLRIWDWKRPVAQGAQRVAALAPSLRRMSAPPAGDGTPSPRELGGKQLMLLSVGAGQQHDKPFVEPALATAVSPTGVVEELLHERGQGGDPEEGLPVTIRELRRKQLATVYEPLLSGNSDSAKVAWNGIPVLTLLSNLTDGDSSPAWPPDLQACTRYKQMLPSMADVLLACMRKDSSAQLQDLAAAHLRAVLTAPLGQQADTAHHRLLITQAWLAQGLQSVLASSFSSCDQQHAQQLRVSLATEASRWFLRELEASTYMGPGVAAGEGQGGMLGRKRWEDRHRLPAYILELGRKEVQRAAALGMLPAIQSELFLPRTVSSPSFQLHALKSCAYGCSGTAPCSTGGDSVQSAHTCGNEVAQILLQQHIQVPVSYLAHYYCEALGMREGSDACEGQGRNCGQGTIEVALLRQAMRLLANMSQWGTIPSGTYPPSLPSVLRSCLTSSCCDAKLRGQAARAAINTGMSNDVVRCTGPALVPAHARYTYGDFLFPLYDEGPACTPSDHAQKEHATGQAASRELDIVLVHGLQGASLKTWRTPVDPLVWLAEQGGEAESKSGGARMLLTRRCSSVYKHGAHMGLWPLLWLVPDLQAEHEQQSVRVIAVQYDADMLSSASIRPPLDLPHVAEQLEQQLHAAGVGRDPERRSTIFICHSLGGIVVKQLLARTALGTSHILPSTSGIVFYGTPHRGSPLAETWVWATGLAASGGVDKGGKQPEQNQADGAGRRWLPALWSQPTAKGSAAEELPPVPAQPQGTAQSHSPLPRGRLSPHIAHLGDAASLRALDDDFQRAIARTASGTRCLSLGEGGPTALRSALSFTGPGSERLGMTIVPPASADPGYGDFLVIPGTDHVDICKPVAREGDARYEAVLHFIRACQRSRTTSSS